MSKKYVPVMLMPFKEDKSIDYTTLEQLIEFYLEAGAGGLFANCLSSEMYQLSKEEMLKSISFVLEKVNGRVPIVATGTFPEPIEDQAAFIKEIYKTGVESVIVITGLMAEESDSDAVFESNVKQLLALTEDVPLGFYECPVPYKRILSADFLGEVVKTGRIKYHKDTCLDINSVRAKIDASVDSEGFGLYDAYMVHAVDSLKSGSAGLSCIQGNYFPELVVWLCDNYAEESEELSRVQEFFTENMNLMHDTYPASAKYILRKRGLDITEVCRNGSTVTGQEVYAQLDELLEEYNQLINVIKEKV